MRSIEVGVLCQNCLKPEHVCRMLREYDRETCCTVCEHRDLPPDIPRT